MKKKKQNRKFYEKLWSTHLSWFPRSLAMFCVKFYCLRSLFGWLLWLLLHWSHRSISIVHLTFVCHCNGQRRRCFYRQQQLEKIVVWSRLSLTAMLAIDLHLFHRNLVAAYHRHHACTFLRRECDGYCHNLNISSIRWDWLNYNSYRSIEAPMQLFPFLFVVHNMANWMLEEHGTHSTFIHLNLFSKKIQTANTQSHHLAEWKLHEKKNKKKNATNTNTSMRTCERDAKNPIWWCFFFSLEEFFGILFLLLKLCRRRLCAFSDSKASRKSNVHRVYWTADRPYLLVSPLRILAILMHSRFASLFIWPLFIWCERRRWPVWVRLCMCQNCVVPRPVSVCHSHHSNNEVSLAVNFLNAKPKVTAFMRKCRVYFDLMVMFCQMKRKWTQEIIDRFLRKKNICFIHLELHLTKKNIKSAIVIIILVRSAFCRYFRPQLSPLWLVCLWRIPLSLVAFRWYVFRLLWNYRGRPHVLTLQLNMVPIRVLSIGACGLLCGNAVATSDRRWNTWHNAGNRTERNRAYPNRRSDLTILLIYSWDRHQSAINVSRHYIVATIGWRHQPK